MFCKIKRKEKFISGNLLIANESARAREIAGANKAMRAQSYSAIMKSALERCAADFSISGGKHLIDHAVELAYRHKDILKAIIGKIIPEATSGESASMRRIILLCPDKSGKVSEVISYDTAPMRNAPAIDCTIEQEDMSNAHIYEQSASDAGGGSPEPAPEINDVYQNYDLASISVSIPSQNESGTISESNVDVDSGTNPEVESTEVVPDVY